MSQQTLEVVENNDPSIEFTLYTVSGTTKTPVNLSGVTIECYIKTSKEDTDTAAVAKYTVANGKITVITPATAGRLRVDMLAADVGSTTAQFYHLDVVAAGRRTTYAYGAIKKINV